MCQITFLVLEGVRSWCVMGQSHRWLVWTTEEAGQYLIFVFAGLGRLTDPEKWLDPLRPPPSSGEVPIGYLLDLKGW